MSDDQTRPPAHSSSIVTLLYLSQGPIVWAVHLTIVYGAHTLMCARGSPGSIALVATATIVVVTLLALALLLLFMIAPRLVRFNSVASDRFSDTVMKLLALLSAFGVAWAGAAALIVGPCDPLR